jgi:hypothetical protein
MIIADLFDSPVHDVHYFGKEEADTPSTYVCSLEKVTGARLTSELFQKWKTNQDEPVQLHSKGTVLADINLPQLADDQEPEILNDPGKSCTSLQHIRMG